MNGDDLHPAWCRVGCLATGQRGQHSSDAQPVRIDAGEPSDPHVVEVSVTQSGGTVESRPWIVLRVVGNGEAFVELDDPADALLIARQILAAYAIAAGRSVTW